MEELLPTEVIYDRISRSESVDEFKEILSSLSDQKERWKTVISQILADNGYSESKMGELCGVSRQSVHKWVNGSIPKNRETFIKIGFAAHYKLDEMNHFLQRYGGYDKLYPKCLEDSVYIFVLSRDDIDDTYRNCENIIGMIKEKLAESEDGDIQEIGLTSAINYELIRLQTLPQMMDFIISKAGIYKTQFYRFYEYVDRFIQKNLLPGGDDNVSLLATSQQWSSSLRGCVSEISQKKWYPQREKIISLGLHLNMDVDQINEMLELAQMEKLCAKTPFESFIIYALENAKLEDIIHTDGTDELCLYVKQLLMEFDIPEGEVFMDELPDDED